jgi:hypothetical protein
MQARPSPVFFHHVWKFVRRQQSSDTAAKSGIFDARGTHRLGRALGTATFFIAESATNATLTRDRCWDFPAFRKTKHTTRCCVL